MCSRGTRYHAQFGLDGAALRGRILAFAGFLFFQASAYGDEFHYLYRGARAQAMGNASTASPSDEDAVFYNPAALAGIETFSLNLTTADVDISHDLVGFYPQVQSYLASPTISGVNTIIGKNLYARGQGTASIQLPGFAFAGIYDQQIALRLKNQSYPQGILATQTTYGAQAGFGLPIYKLKKKRGELRWGVAAKALWRSGGYQRPNLTQILTIDYQTFMSGVNNMGTGYGVDTGFQFEYKLRKKLSFYSGLTYTDIGDTGFSGGADDIKKNMSFGLSAVFKDNDLAATLAYNYSHILDYADWRKKTHLGLELKFPFLSLYAGLNQLYPTYGAGLDFWLFSVMYLSYAEEQATLVYQDPERRSMVHVSFKLSL